MSDLQDNIYNLSAVLDTLQNNAHPAQKPILRLLGDHLRLLALCMDLSAYCPDVQTPHMPPSAAAPSAHASSDPDWPARPAGQDNEARHVYQ
ncbi:MAG: hypothetical protein DESF_01104 [Desulfovibrio sp.]